MPNLTKRQKQILDYITKFIDKNEIAPTGEEIKKHFGLSALSTVHEHIEALVEKGFLEKHGSSARGIALKNQEEQTNFIEVPIWGTITAGQPLEMVEEHEETIAISKDKVRGSCQYFALRVLGNSMVDEGIFNGDTVVIKEQSVAENGQTVVAVLEGDKATLKKIYKEKNRFRLQPANQTMLPIYAREVEIKGVVVEIRHSFEGSSAQNDKKLKPCRTLDLFAGVGGIRMGFENAGFKTVFSNDFEKNCKDTYDLNFKTSKLVVEDIRKIGINDLPDFDFLLAGFPCQAFSIAGYRKGFEDDKGRGNLFFDIARIIEARQPMGFMLENVKNLKGHDGGKTFRIIMQTLEDLGYHIKSQVLNSMEYGNVPQNRERIYIVGFKDKNKVDSFSFPAPKALSKKATDMLEENVGDKYYYNGKPLYEKLKGAGMEEGRVYQWRRKYVRENKKGVFPTLTANMGMGGHNVPIIKDKKGIRKLTPLECFRIQGFPNDFKLPSNIADSALYKQAGNSVTVSVIERVANSIMKVLEV